MSVIALNTSSSLSMISQAAFNWQFSSRKRLIFITVCAVTSLVISWCGLIGCDGCVVELLTRNEGHDLFHFFLKVSEFFLFRVFLLLSTRNKWLTRRRCTQTAMVSSTPPARNVAIPANHACVAANVWQLNYINFKFSNVSFNSQFALAQTLKLWFTVQRPVGLHNSGLIFNQGSCLLGWPVVNSHLRGTPAETNKLLWLPVDTQTQTGSRPQLKQQLHYWCSMLQVLY